MSHQLIVHLITILIRQPKFFVYDRINNRQPDIRIIAVCHMQAVNVFVRPGNYRIKRICRVQHVKRPVKFHRIRRCKNLKIAAFALKHFRNRFYKPFVVCKTNILA